MILYAGRFLRRLVIYQIIFFSTIMKFQNLQKYSTELIDKITIQTTYFNLKIGMIDYFLLNPEPLTKYLTIVELIFALLAVFGLKVGAFLSGMLYFFTTLIYFNPILPENRLSVYGVKIELLFSLGVIIVIMIDCFSGSKVIVKSEDIDEEENDGGEKRNKGKKKKKID